MEVRLLCVGDVVGSPGRRVLRAALETLLARERIDCVIVNAENVASGSGITTDLYNKIVACGADLITLGDHIYRRREIISTLDTAGNIVRPANLPPTAPGREYAVCPARNGVRVGVVSLLGRLFMKLPVDCPFRTADRVLASMPRDVRVVAIDMHAEATSEKIAMGWYLDGRVSVVFGTHTHVPTADERVLPKGTAYVTDLGMTGPYDSVLGRAKENVLAVMVGGVPVKLEVADGNARLSGVKVTVDAGTGRALDIERIVFNEGDAEQHQAK
jgi:hypothetical protein